MQRAVAIRNIIQHRRDDIGDNPHRKYGNFIAQNLALYSSTPIKTVIDDEVEIARQYKNIENYSFDDYMGSNSIGALNADERIGTSPSIVVKNEP